MRVIDLRQTTDVHVVGVGGAGMNAIAAVLVEMGHRVSGSDLKPSGATERLRTLGVEVFVGHDATNVGPDVAVVTRSAAVPDQNPEIVAARERGITVLRRAEILGAMCAVKPTVAVAGTHGKTTTSSMLAVTLLHAGTEPSFIIGGELNEIGGGAAWQAEGHGAFVVEADESDGTFIELAADHVVVTSVEPDHIEHWGGFDELRAAFGRFVDEARGVSVVCADDAGAAAVAGPSTVTYGEHPDATVRLTGRRVEGTSSVLTVVRHRADPVEIALAVPGHHNALNATAAFAMATELGVEPDVAAAALARYTGVARRFEFRGAAGGVTFVDDYAHLPSEVRAAIAAGRELTPERVVCVFQPHRYSRTANAAADFAGAFAGVDDLVITDIYSAGEAPRPGVSGRLVVDAVDSDPDSPPVTYAPDPQTLLTVVAGRLRPGDLCLTLGAGDLTALPGALIERLGHRRASR